MQEIQQKQWATRAIFFLTGFGFTVWAGLIPLIKFRLNLGDDVMGLVILCLGLGSLVTMPMGSKLCNHYGCQRMIGLGAVLFGCLLPLLALAPSTATLIVFVLCFGATAGLLEASMNIHSVLVEKLSPKSAMSSYHAMFSAGSLVGASCFSLLLFLGSTGLINSLLGAALVVALRFKATPYLLPYGDREAKGKKTPLFAIPKGIVVLIGLVAFTSFLVEGAVMDWGGIYLTTVHNLDISLSSIGFAIFSVGMLLMRTLGDRIIHSVGGQPLAYLGLLIGLIAYTTLIVADSLWLVLPAFFFVGIGMALIIPIFFALITKQNDMATGTAAAACTTSGYLGLMIGPGIIGVIAEYTSLTTAFGVLCLLLLVMLMLARRIYQQMG